MKRTALSLTILSLLIFSITYAANISGKVIGVSDGDTIKVLVGKETVKVRLWGIDCPESGQAYGNKAKQFTSNMVFGKFVTVDVRDTDRYGRSVGWVIVEKKALSLELVKAGMAWWYTRYAPNATDLKQAEQLAKKEKRGLWIDAHPVAPWNWRHGESKSKSPPNNSSVQTNDTSGNETSTTASPHSTAVDTVYITKSGECYHAKGCSSLSRSCISITRKDAIAKGYRACSRCNP